MLRSINNYYLSSLVYVYRRPVHITVVVVLVVARGLWCKHSINMYYSMRRRVPGSTLHPTEMPLYIFLHSS